MAASSDRCMKTLSQAVDLCLKICLGLQAGAVRRELHKTDYRRLNLGVAAAAIALTAVRTLHWDTQSALGHLETVFQGGLTGAGTYSISLVFFSF